MNLKFMQPILVRTSFLAFTFVAIASFGGILTACSNATQSDSNLSQNQSQTPASPTDTGEMKGMDHSGMNHNMAMDLGPADANYDLRFIDAMTPHHQGAVEMAKEAQQKSQRPEIKKLAADIIKAQDKEIAQLKQWRTAWYPQAGDQPMAHDAKTGQMMPMSSLQMKGMMMNTDLGYSNAEFDLRFINAMIPHHEGAVTMATDAQSKSKRPEIKKLSQDIVTSQKAEIEQMKQWKQAWYKQ